MSFFSTVFVTVGTMEFLEFLDKILKDEILALCQQVQCKLPKIPFGHGKCIDASTIERAATQYSIKIECYEFIIE